MHITKNINIQVIKRTATNQYKIQFLPGKKKKLQRILRKDSQNRISNEKMLNSTKNTVMKVKTMKLHILSSERQKLGAR